MNSMTIYLYEIDHPIFIENQEENNSSKSSTKKQKSSSNSNMEKTSSKDEKRREKRRRKREEKKREQQENIMMNPFSSMGTVRLMEQQSCSAGAKEDLLSNCQSSIIELLDGQLGLVNLLHPFRIQGPEPIRRTEK